MAKEDKMWIASFDPGKYNFAFCIEEISISKINSIHDIPKGDRYWPDGTPTERFASVLDSIFSNGTVTIFKNSDLSKNCRKGSCVDLEMFHNLTELLDQYSDWWDKCSFFVIEQQMSFGKRRNTMALKIAQHCYSYFIFRYGRFKQVIDFPAYNKTQILGAQKLEYKSKRGKVAYKALDKPARKKWSVVKATEILSNRKDEETLKNLTTKRKKDDLADVLCQLQAFKYLAFVQKSIEL